MWTVFKMVFVWKWVWCLTGTWIRILFETNRQEKEEQVRENAIKYQFNFNFNCLFSYLELLAEVSLAKNVTKIIVTAIQEKICNTNFNSKNLQYKLKSTFSSFFVKNNNIQIIHCFSLIESKMIFFYFLVCRVFVYTSNQFSIILFKLFVHLHSHSNRKSILTKQLKICTLDQTFANRTDWMILPLIWFIWIKYTKSAHFIITLIDYEPLTNLLLRAILLLFWF